jgi:glycosyltransferase involved in cell wall biosynthesis
MIEKSFNPDVSIVLPIFKNKDTLSELHYRLVQTMQSYDYTYEIIFIDDASPDLSLEVLKQLHRQDAHITIIQMAQNVGQQNAVLAGLCHARGNNIATLDADLQDPPESIPRLMDKLGDGYDVVFAGRKGQYQTSQRLMTSRLYKWTLHILTGVPANAGLYLVMTRVAKNNILKINTDTPHLVAMIGVLGMRSTSIPIERQTRPYGESAYTSFMRFKVGMGVVAWTLLWKIGFRDYSRTCAEKFPIKVVHKPKYNFKEDIHAG